MTTLIEKNKTYLLLLILLIALSLRLWNLTYDSPFIYHPDEPSYIAISQTIFKTGDLNPHFFNYPSLFFYINTLAYIPYYGLGKLVGAFSSPENILSPMSLTMGVTQNPIPSTALLGRLVTVVFGLATVGLTYFTGQKLTQKPAVGLGAALLVAISAFNVWHSRFITPDTFVTFFALLSLFMAVQVYQKGSWVTYIGAGFCIGLTIASKYNGAIVGIVLAMAHLLRHGRVAWKIPVFYLSLVMVVAGFLAATPFALLDFPKFWADVQFEREHYSLGHWGMEGNALQWYVTHMWQTGAVIYLLAWVQIGYGIISRSPEKLLLASFPLIYFLFISSFQVRNDRTFLPLNPFLFLLASWLMVELWLGLTQKQFGKGVHLAPTILCLSIVGFQFSQTLTSLSTIAGVSNRETGRVWIAENLPVGSKIALEAYSPYVEPTQYTVQGFMQLMANSPEWYVENEFDYLVFSEVMYGRFFLEPEKYAPQITQYNAFFERFTLVKQFSSGDAEIRIYKIEE